MHASRKTKTVKLSLKLTAQYDKPVIVSVDVVGGNASAEDYSIAESVVKFEPGQTERSLSITLAADGEQEPTETIKLALRDVQNARLLGQSKHTTYICSKSYRQLGGAFYFRHQSGARWEKYAKVGPWADVMVKMDPGDDRLIFWRGASYRPFLDTAEGPSFVDVLVPQNGDGPAPMFDHTNRHSHIRIVESSPARVVVQWRYLPDFQRRALPWWTEEYFTIYPDGVCFRSVHQGTATPDQYNDPSHAIVEKLLLTDRGICPLPNAWRTDVAVTYDSQTLQSFDDLGYDQSKGGYLLQAKSAGVAAPIALTFGADISHPALFVRSWAAAGVSVSVNGNPLDRFRVGHLPRMDSSDVVLWINADFKAGDQLVVRPVGESQTIVRAEVRDPYLSQTPLLPEGSADPGPFGAFYTTLKYWDEWDEPWRVGDYADVVVQFDGSPNRLVFWRGTTFVPHWVNEANHWYNNEFCERRGGDSGLDGLCEPMQDHDSDFSNVRILSSTPARAVVHWRYSPPTLKGNIPFTDSTGWGDCVDEYHYVYPDETCVRDTTLYTSRPNVFNEWHEAIPLINPGKNP